MLICSAVVTVLTYPQVIKLLPMVPANVSGPIPQFYAPEFRETLSRPPDSAFLADGSEVKVYKPRRIG